MLPSTATAWPGSPSSTVGPEAQLHLNESPLDPSGLAVEHVIRAARTLNRYPQHLRGRVHRAVARHLGVPADSVLLTSGVDEAVDLVFSLVDAAWITAPGFPGYADRAAVTGLTTRTIPLDDDWQPTLPPARLTEGGVVLLAQPSNPTGTLFDRNWTDEVIRQAELVFLDETYGHFADRPRSWVPGVAHAANLLVFISFSKAYGLAGVRAGAVVAQPRVIARLAAVQRYDSVDSIALAAVEGTLADTDYLAALPRYVRRLRRLYTDRLATCPVFAEVRGTQANFVLARPVAADGAAELVARLALRGVRVCDAAGLGLPGWIRVSVGTEEDLLTLLAALGDNPPGNAGTPSPSTRPENAQ
ncbi:aminotransferase class I/II-fold pyridoxal phosphate-dependent enzyme [Streptomyces hygroscopicus]|uniref:pyridoxal phosphate-dependent aminotransferase n=1 Tax=Streptomyces hygroscopicus TaxID=1912 RepID=UPI0033D5884F